MATISPSSTGSENTVAVTVVFDPNDIGEILRLIFESLYSSPLTISARVDIGLAMYSLADLASLSTGATTSSPKLATFPLIVLAIRLCPTELGWNMADRFFLERPAFNSPVIYFPPPHICPPSNESSISINCTPASFDASHSTSFISTTIFLIVSISA